MKVKSLRTEILIPLQHLKPAPKLVFILKPHLEGRQAPQASSPFRTPTAGSLQSWDRSRNIQVGNEKKVARLRVRVVSLSLAAMVLQEPQWWVNCHMMWSPHLKTFCVGLNLSSATLVSLFPLLVWDCGQPHQFPQLYNGDILASQGPETLMTSHTQSA